MVRLVSESVEDENFEKMDIDEVSPLCERFDMK